MRLWLVAGLLVLAAFQAACGEPPGAREREVERLNDSGLELAGEGLWEDAKAQFSAAIDLLPDDAESRYNRAVISLKLGDYRGAVSDLQVSVGAAGDDADAHVKLGVAYVHLLDYRRAAAELDRAVRLDPTAREAYAYRITTNIHLGRLDAAVADLMKFRSLTAYTP